MQYYQHKVQYYETDTMKIVHHSNYIRWMEEARVAFLESIGWGYDRLEEDGVVSPVTAVDCKYKISTRFPETIRIAVTVEAFSGVTLKLKYMMLNSKDEVVSEGTSEHCFLDEAGRIISVKKKYPQLYQVLSDLVNKSK